jgi:hypothetical protein
LAAEIASADSPFEIQIVDSQTGRGVPLVELKTVGEILYHTDSNGVVAFDEPGLMDQRVFLWIASHGYEFPKDGFGNSGTTVKVVPGGSVKLKIERINVAQRLYRITGGGIYRDTLLLGRSAPVKRPLLNGLVLGSDSVINDVYRGQMHWFWGDTNRPSYPLGNFKVSGATSLLPDRGGLDPNVGVDLEYFVDETGFAKQMAPLKAQGPTWLSGLVVLGEDPSSQRMLAHYVNIRGGENNFEATERGLVEFDDQAEEFKKVAEFPDLDLFPSGGHPFLHTVNDTEYIYYCDPYPLVRVKADVEYLAKLETYQAFTCLEPGTRLTDERFDRAPGGSLRWAWKTNTDPVRPMEQSKLEKSGKIPKDQAVLALRDVDAGKPIVGHRGSVYWNAYRARWVMIFCETFGTSMLGEIWYAEADRSVGPWVWAKKIVTHDKYSFYNPKQHPAFDQDGGRTIFFEGTYTTFISGNPVKTPRYNYNQIMYKLDLADERLNLPVAFYRRSDSPIPCQLNQLEKLDAPDQDRPIMFWACDRAKAGMVPVYERQTETAGANRLQVGATATEENARPLFFALPPDAGPASEPTVGLYEFRHSDGRRAYSAENNPEMPAGFERSGKPLCRVWRHPLSRSLRLSD